MTDQGESKIISQENFDKLITKYFIHSMIPLHHIEEPHFKKIFSVFNIEKIGLNIMSRSVLETRIEDAYTKVRSGVAAKLKLINHICITAEHIWTSLIVTGYWIDSDFRRQSLTLACRPRDYRHFSLKYCDDQEMKQIPDISAHYKKLVDEEKEQSKDKYEVYLSDAVVVFTDINETGNRMHAQLYIDKEIKLHVEDKFEKDPKIQRVISTWNRIIMASDAPEYALITQKILGYSLSRPEPYQYDFNDYNKCQQILSIREKHKELQTALEIKYPLIDSDFVLIDEYSKLCKPFVDASKILQDEGGSFYGNILPCLLSIRKKLIRFSNEDYEYVYCEPAKCLQVFEENYAEFFALSSYGAMNAAIAAVSYPKFKEKWFNCIDCQYHDKIRDAFQQAVIEEIKKVDRQPIGTNQDLDGFFEFETNLDDQKTKAKSLITRYLYDKSTHLRMLHRHKEIKNVFIKYNTPIPVKNVNHESYLFKTLENIRSAIVPENLQQKMMFLKCNGDFM